MPIHPLGGDFCHGMGPAAIGGVQMEMFEKRGSAEAADLGLSMLKAEGPRGKHTLGEAE